MTALRSHVAPHQLGEALLEVRTGGDLLRRACGDNPAGIDDGHVVAQALHRGHDVAGDDHGAAGGGVVPQDRLDRLGGDRVDGLEGLIQDQNGGRVNHGAGQVDLLAHTRRVVGYQGGSGIPQPQYLDQLSRPGHDDVALEPRRSPE